MASHYQNYVSNFNRVRLSELIDYYALQSRIELARPSLVVNPLTSLPYGSNSEAPLSGPSQNRIR